MVTVSKGEYLRASLRQTYKEIINEEIEIEESEAKSLGLIKNDNQEELTPQEPINIYDYLVYEAVDNCYFGFGTTSYWAGNIYYSTDLGYHWNNLESHSITPLILKGNKILFKGNVYVFGDTPEINVIGKYKLSGNLNSIKYINSSNNNSLYLGNDNCISIKDLIISNSINNLHIYGDLLEELEIPNNITQLYISCSKLTELEIPNTVTNLNINECTGLTELEIPSSVTNLNIYGCTGLTEIEIPNSVTDLTINGCTGLTELEIPNSVINLDCNFYGYNNLTYIIFGSRITYIDNYYNLGTYNLENLEYIQILSENFNINHLSNIIDSLPYQTIIYLHLNLKSILQEIYGNCYEYNGHTIRYIGESEPIIEPTGQQEPTGEIEPTGETGQTEEIEPYQITYKHLDYIEWSEFANNNFIISVEIPGTIRKIESYAFSNCKKLESVIIPDSVTNLGGYIFSNCSSLISISIPNSIYSLPGGMFYNCTSLQTFNIPKNIESIGSSCFEGCMNLTSIIMNSNIRALSDNVFKNCTNLTSFNFNNISNIFNECFKNCISLTEINLTKACYLGDYVFENCSNLLKVTLNNNVIDVYDGNITIGSYAFNNCTSLRELNIICKETYGSTHNELKYKIVNGCTSLNKITYLCSNQEDINNIERDTWGTVANSGVFIKNPDVTISLDQIPEGWTIQDYVEE